MIDQARERIGQMFSFGSDRGEYDAIVCYSGGKDSSYTLSLAVNKYKLRVLAFTLDNGHLSSYALDNINRVVDSLGIDHIMVRPAQPHMKAIIKASALYPIYNQKTLMRISSICQSCISIVNITAIKFALEKKVRFILAGFTLGQIPTNAVVYQNNYNFFKESRKSSLDKLRSHTGDYVDRYFCLDESLLKEVKEFPYNINLLCLEDISEDQIVEEVKKMGWRSPKDVDGCSSNCRLNTFNNIVHKKIHGYNPYELELSHLIRKGQIGRDQAIEKLEDQHDGIYRKILGQLDLNEGDIDQAIIRNSEEFKVS